MSGPMIESMESRVLLTASAAVIEQDVANLEIAGTNAKADLKTALIAIAADVKVVKLTVAAAHPTATQKSALHTFANAEVIAAAKYKARISGILGAGYADGVRVDTLLKTLEKHPTNTTLLARVQAAVAKLANVFSTTVISTVESNASAAVTTVDTDLNAVAAAVPTASTPVGTLESALGTDVNTTLPADATAIQGAISTLATDLA